MIVDSSVWIEFFRGSEGKETRFLNRALLAQRFIAITPTILQETLQGASTPSVFRNWRAALSDAVFLKPQDLERTHVNAAQLYMRCRIAGITPRSANDCLIAATAIEFDLPLLQRDQDFDRIARIDPNLRIVEPAPGS